MKMRLCWLLMRLTLVRVRLDVVSGLIKERMLIMLLLENVHKLLVSIMDRVVLSLVEVSMMLLCLRLLTQRLTVQT